MGAAHYLVAFANEIGIGSMTWETVQSWATITRRTLAGWEAEALMAIGREYKEAVFRYDRIAAPAPWRDFETIDREAVAERVRNMLRGGRNGRHR